MTDTDIPQEPAGEVVPETGTPWNDGEETPC